MEDEEWVERGDEVRNEVGEKERVDGGMEEMGNDG